MVEQMRINGESLDTEQSSRSAIKRRLNNAAGPDSISEVARITRTSRETTRRYMAQGRPSVEFIITFCRSYDVNPTWLLFGLGPRLLSSQCARSPVEHDATELAAELHRLLSAQSEAVG
jgi:hypothetical protein